MSPDRVLEQASPDQAAAAWMDGLAEAVDATTLHPGWFPVLSRVSLFQTLPKRHLKRIGRLAELQRFKQGAQVVREGGRGDSLYIILDGTAELTTEAGHTHELKAGDHFGELALLDGAPRSATITASGSIAAAKIRRNDFLALLKEEPAIGAGLAHGLVAIVRELQRG